MKTRIVTSLCLILLLAGAADAQKKKRQAPKRGSAQRSKVSAVQRLDIEAINTPLMEAVAPDSSGAATVRAQILLDRAHFSPGEIDGHYGKNLAVAVHGFQVARKVPVTGVVDGPTWRLLNKDTAPVLVPYTITADEAAGPFVPIPAETAEKAKLKGLGYASAQEGLAEKFHLDPKLLERLNPGKDLTKAGEQILVPNVAREKLVPAARVIVSKVRRTVTAYAADGTMLAQYPATIGSEHDPLPVGEWVITAVQRNPWFNYNPDLFWDAKPGDDKARLPPGPNNPVGSVWIGLSKEHYGIHGTPEPGTVGHTESHGCIRLTNWDASELAGIVKMKLPVELMEDAPAPASGAPAPAAPPVITPPPAVPPAAPLNDQIGLPIAGLTAADLSDTFDHSRTGHKHEAMDIMKPRGTPVVAAVDGPVMKLFLSKPGGITVYQFDNAKQYCYYYAHLDRYADGVKEGMQVKRGQLLAYVGSTGDASPGAPHLHFEIMKLGPEKKWWSGTTSINPYPVLRALVK